VPAPSSNQIQLRKPPFIPIPCPQDCPKSTATLQAFVADNTLDAANAALLRALRNASFSPSFLDGIEVQSNARIRAIMTTPGAGADLTYAVTSGVRLPPALSARLQPAVAVLWLASLGAACTPLSYGRARRILPPMCACMISPCPPSSAVCRHSEHQRR